MSQVDIPVEEVVVVTHRLHFCFSNFSRPLCTANVTTAPRTKLSLLMESKLSENNLGADETNFFFFSPACHFFGLTLFWNTRRVRKGIECECVLYNFSRTANNTFHVWPNTKISIFPFSSKPFIHSSRLVSFTNLCLPFETRIYTENSSSRVLVKYQSQLPSVFR